MIAAVLFFLMGLLCPMRSPEAAVRQNPQTNLEWLAALMDSTTLDLSRQNFLVGGDPIVIEVQSADSLFAGVQESFLRERLVAHNARVITRAGAGAHRKLNLRWAEWSVEFRAMNDRTDRFERNLRALFFVEMVDQRSEVTFAKRHAYALRDTLSQSERDLVASPSLPFTMASNQRQEEDHPLWRRAFLFAISATVVYLFYSIRSQ